MRLMNLLPRNAILVHFDATDREAAIRELSEALASCIPNLKQDEVFCILLEREKLGSTAIGQGIAIPHARSSLLRRPVLCFAKSEKGVEFGASDGKPVYLFFAMLSPENHSTTHIKVLAKMTEILKNPSAREELYCAHSAEEIAEILNKYDSDF